MADRQGAKPGTLVALALGVMVIVGAAAWLWGASPSIVTVSSVAAAVGAGSALVLAARMRRTAPVTATDHRWTALLGAGASARETLAAVEQLTDPLAVERRITRAMRELAAEARLELLRAPDAPEGVLAQARPAEPELMQLAIGAGVLRRAVAPTQAVADRMALIPADVLLVVRYDARAYGLLAIEGEVQGAALLQLRRFTDLLAFKLELHRVYEELAHREQLAALGAFASALAHDLRSPLSSIALSVQGLAAHREALGGDAELLEIAGDEARRLTGYVGELVDFSRPVELRTRDLDPKAVIDSVARRHRRTANDAGVELRVDVAAELPAIVGDAARLERVVDNLLANAIAVAPRGSDVRLTVRPDEEHVRIEVADRGPGIPRAEHEKIFQPFFTRRQGGTGLGLAIVRRIVQAHRGTVQVDSAVGRGTTMIVRLPGRVTCTTRR